MFFPFEDYNKITWDIHTGGSFHAKYTIPYKCFIVLEIPVNEGNDPYLNSVRPACQVRGVGDAYVTIFEEFDPSSLGVGSSNMSGTGGCGVFNTGNVVYWRANHNSGSGQNFVTLHVFRLQE